jgi:hypothetical protein
MTIRMIMGFPIDTSVYPFDIDLAVHDFWTWYEFVDKATCLESELFILWQMDNDDELSAFENFLTSYDPASQERNNASKG